MTTYPVEIHIQSPARFDRIQLLVRLVVGAALGVLGVSTGWVGWALYLLLPALAAVFISARGAPAYLDQVGPPLTRVLGWLIGFQAYMALAIDRLPVGHEHDVVRMEVHPGGHPTVSGALLRLVTSLPAAILLAILMAVSGLLALVGMIAVLFTCTQPDWLLRFQRAVVAYAGRLGCYHAALVAPYPPLSFDESPPTPAKPAAPGLSAG
jgi:hypothetical protein